MEDSSRLFIFIYTSKKILRKSGSDRLADLLHGPHAFSVILFTIYTLTSLKILLLEMLIVPLVCNPNCAVMFKLIAPS